MRPRFLVLLEPWLGSLTPLLVPGYVFMLVLGAVLGSILIVDRARRVGFDPRDTLSVLMYTYAMGLAGAGAVPLLQALLSWIEGGGFGAKTGIAAYGGLVGGAAGTWLALKRRGFGGAAIRRFFDAGAPAVALGIFFARVGCFLAGCDYGSPTSSALGVSFPEGSHAWADHLARGWISPSAAASLPVHPTQLYEAAAGLGLWALVTVTRERTRFAVLAVGYAILRSFIEVFRGDASRGHVGPLSTSHVFALVTSLVVGLLWIHARRNAQRAETTASSEAVLS